MSNDDLVYRYSIPLENVNGSEKPAYEPSYSDKVYTNHYKANVLVIEQDAPIPHFHREGVNVKVEEIDMRDYK